MAKKNSCALTGCLWMLLIIGIFCSFIGAILTASIGVISTPSLLLVGLPSAIVGGITLLFSAFQHTHFAESFNKFIDDLSRLPSSLVWARFLVWPFITFLIFCILFFVVVHIPPINDRICQRTIVSWGIICGGALGTITQNVPETGGGSVQIKYGLIDTMSYGPFDMDNQKSEEMNVEQKIFAENQRIAQNPHVTLAIITELSRTSDDNSVSANVGLADLRSSYLFQVYYNKLSTHTVKLRLIIGNIGTRLTADNTVPFIMGHIALLAKQDSTFRGILGLPFSGATGDALNSRKDLSIEQIPMIAPSTSSDVFYNEKNFYRIVSPNRTQSCVGLDFIVNHLISALGHTKNQQFKVALFKDKGDAYSRDLANDLEAEKTGNISCSSYSRSLATSNLITFPEYYTRGQQQQDFQGSIDDAIHQQMDLVFFSGYSDDLNNFETFLSQEQDALHYQKRILIVGGDGQYETTSTGKTHTTYVTIYVPPLTGNSSDLEKYFVTQYQDEFGTSNIGRTSAGILFPPHALEIFDAANAFTTAIQNATSVPSPDDFDQSLQNIDFNGLTGSVQFNGNQTENQTRGISDPLHKDIYVMCTNKDGTKAVAAMYSPGPTPTIKPYLEGQNLLDCKSS